jgi:hypothetical protein
MINTDDDLKRLSQKLTPRATKRAKTFRLSIKPLLPQRRTRSAKLEMIRNVRAMGAVWGVYLSEDMNMRLNSQLDGASISDRFAFKTCSPHWDQSFLVLYNLASTGRE